MPDPRSSSSDPGLVTILEHDHVVIGPPQTPPLGADGEMRHPPVHQRLCSGSRELRPDVLLHLRIRPKKGVFVGNLRNDPDAAESRPEFVSPLVAQNRDSVSRLDASLAQPLDDGGDLLLGYWPAAQLQIVR